MSTTSSFPFSTMEVPLMDDSMEMASPYHGHADDFEIDIDVMEDQDSNPDRDMAVVDEYVDTSNGGIYEHDGLPDEEMVDDMAEPSMIDADEYPGTNRNIEMQDTEGKSYEAEMLEDEYDEDIDAPVPEHEQEVSTSSEAPGGQETSRASPTPNDQDVCKNSESTPLEHQRGEEPDYPDKTRLDALPVPDQAADPPKQPFEQPESARLQSGFTEEGIGNPNEPKQADPEVVRDNIPQEGAEKWQKHGNGEENLESAQLSSDELKRADVQSHDEKQPSGSGEQEAEKEHVDPALHPVKVYYQDNEISLFPPREGDSTETFFLEDEGLAYCSFEKLFESCRGVLQDHVTENEVLVVDIEPLNIQLIEDSLQTSKVTLKQIIDVYLQLCHNDGIGSSDALYLTLSTKLTVSAELSNLFLAASEGKGLSGIQPWEVYPEAEDSSAKFDESAQETYPEEPQDALDNGDERTREFEPTSPDQDAPNLESTEPGSQSVEEVEANDADTNPIETESQIPAPVEHESSNSDPNDLEEQETDSTSTAEPSASIDTPGQLLGTKDGATGSHDDEEKEDSEDEYEDPEEVEPDVAVRQEEESYVDDSKLINGDDEVGEDTGEFTEGHPEEYHDLHSEFLEPQTPEEAAAEDASQNHEDTVAENLKIEDTTKESEPLLDGNSATSQSHQTPHFLDHSLGTAEDLLKSPDNDLKDLDQVARAWDASELEEPDETAEQTSAFRTNTDEAADLPFNDEEEYFDLGIAEDLDDFDEGNVIAPPNHVSAKRAREPEDELDKPESTTPEVKRTRSS
ncbi:uncharacterized protein BJX67DRAFT_89142 [Aspergillus lucknowensis]|uniref:Uncharacterized protein n=1 Tax=Aspergillus lucknowensis TaxID=176173 RepID=A0ABR4M5M7_9EURO